MNDIIPITNYQDYQDYQNIKKMKNKSDMYDEKNNRWYCSKHITHTIHPFHKKCFLCRIEDNDVKLCRLCNKNYYNPKRFDICATCALPKINYFN